MYNDMKNSKASFA